MPANVQQIPREFDDLLGLEPEVEAVSPPQNPPTLISESDLAERWGVSTPDRCESSCRKALFANPMESVFRFHGSDSGLHRPPHRTGFPARGE